MGRFSGSQPRKVSRPYDLSRIVEITAATGKQVPSATIIREYLQEYCPDGEPYSPIPVPDAKVLCLKCAELSAQKMSASSAAWSFTTTTNIGQLVGMILAELDRFLSNG